MQCHSLCLRILHKRVRLRQLLSQVHQIRGRLYFKIGTWAALDCCDKCTLPSQDALSIRLRTDGGRWDAAVSGGRHRAEQNSVKQAAVPGRPLVRSGLAFGLS